MINAMELLKPVFKVKEIIGHRHPKSIKNLKESG